MYNNISLVVCNRRARSSMDFFSNAIVSRPSDFSPKMFIFEIFLKQGLDLIHIVNKNEKRSEGGEHDVKNFNEDIIGN